MLLCKQDAAIHNSCWHDRHSCWADKHWCYVRGRRDAIFSRVDLFRSGNRMSNSTMMSPRLLGSFGYGRPSPAICRTVVGFIVSGILSETVRLLSVGTLTVTPPSIAYKHNIHDNLSHNLSSHPFSRFCTIHSVDGHRDRQTDHTMVKIVAICGLSDAAKNQYQ